MDIAALKNASTREEVGKALRSIEAAAIESSRDPSLSTVDQFWAVDDVMCTLAPDAGPELTARWCELYDQMTPEFLQERWKVRGPKT